MRAYKVLSDGRSSFTGWAWPLPDGEQPGRWVNAKTPLALCRRGIHACSADQLPQWLGEEIWEVELEGEVLREEPAIVAEKARLVRRIEAWDDRARMNFARACLDRAGQIAADYAAAGELVAKVEHCVSWGGAAHAGYFTALLAERAPPAATAGPTTMRRSLVSVRPGRLVEAGAATPALTAPPVRARGATPGTRPSETPSRAQARLPHAARRSLG